MIRPHRTARIFGSTAWVTRNIDFRLTARTSSQSLSVIPSMGYMALLRNLRNFDEAGISDERARYVREVLADPERVAKSRQFPYRFWSAYKNVPSLDWASTLEKALELDEL